MKFLVSLRSGRKVDVEADGFDVLGVGVSHNYLMVNFYTGDDRKVGMTFNFSEVEYIATT
jgi:hypothetical protein